MEINEIEIGSIWKHKRRGYLLCVEAINRIADVATLRHPAGGLTQLPLLTLATLYTPTLDPIDAAAFAPDPEPDDDPPAATPEPTLSGGVAPMPTRWANRGRRYGNDQRAKRAA